MADRFGKFLSGVLSGTLGAMAPGARFNAAKRRQSEVFLLDEAGAIVAIGTTIAIASLRGGDVLDEVVIAATTASLAGVSFSVGTKANATKYSAAIAGPAANAQVRIKIVDAAELAGTEQLFLTTSVGALPTTGGAKMQVDTYYSHK